MSWNNCLIDSGFPANFDSLNFQIYNWIFKNFALIYRQVATTQFQRSKLKFVRHVVPFLFFYFLFSTQIVIGYFQFQELLRNLLEAIIIEKSYLFSLRN